MNDLFKDSKEWASMLSKIQGMVGMAVILTPILEASILQRTGGSLRAAYLALSCLGLAQLLTAQTMLQETLVKAKDFNISELLKAANPFSFLRIFASPNTAFKRIFATTVLQQFNEGKNLSDLGQLYMREQLKWGPVVMRNMAVSWGLNVVIQAAVIVPFLTKKLSVGAFTTVANALLALGLCIQGCSDSGPLYMLGAYVGLPGMNGSSANALRGVANVMAAEDGFGAEYAAMFNNCRSIVGSFATLVLGFTYARCVEKGMNPGNAYIVSAILGCMVPQAMLYYIELPPSSLPAAKDERDEPADPKVLPAGAKKK